MTQITWIVAGDENAYGVGRATESLMKEMAARGYGVSAAALRPGPIVDRLKRHGEVVVAKDPGLEVPGFMGDSVAGKLRSFWARREVVGAARRFATEASRGLGSTVLHVQWPSLVGISGAAARAVGATCFWEIPNTVSASWLGLNRAYYQWTCRRFGVRPLANSAHTAASLGHSLVDPSVFHLGADEGLFDPERTVALDRRSLGIPPTSSVIAMAARMSPSKAQLRLTAAVLDRLEAGQDWHLVFAGGPLDGAEATAVRGAAAASGREGHVHLLGETDQIAEVFAGCDVACSLRDVAEPFGLSVVEAMLMGKPVLVRALGGPAETVVDGETGWHTDTIEHAALAAALDRVHADRPHWAAMGRAARERALSGFTYKRVGDRYVEALANAGIR